MFKVKDMENLEDVFIQMLGRKTKGLRWSGNSTIPSCHPLLPKPQQSRRPFSFPLYLEVIILVSWHHPLPGLTVTELQMTSEIFFKSLVLQMWKLRPREVKGHQASKSLGLKLARSLICLNCFSLYQGLLSLNIRKQAPPFLCSSWALASPRRVGVPPQKALPLGNGVSHSQHIAFPCQMKPGLWGSAAWSGSTKKAPTIISSHGRPRSQSLLSMGSWWGLVGGEGRVKWAQGEGSMSG